MPPRFYAPDLDPASSDLTLSEEESRHLERVLRLRKGDPVSVFDGRGHEHAAVVMEIGARAVRLRVGPALRPAVEPRVLFTLGHGLVKGDGEDDLVRDATMLGVHVLQPLWTARTAVRRTGFRHGHHVARWQRVAVASCKQCGRAVVPDVRPPIPLRDLLASGDPGLGLLLLEPGASGEAMPLAALSGTRAPDRATVLVGPEGGWSPEEIQAAVASGYRPFRLGGRTLRSDAVPIVAIALLLSLWGDL